MIQSDPSPIKNFDTARLAMRNWISLLESAEQRRNLELSLGEILTPRVLEHLPEPLQLLPSRSAISKWVSARTEESDVYVVSSKCDDATVGLLILAESPETAGVRTIHLGYLLAEEAWSKGYATELVSGLVVSLKDGPRAQLVGGVGKGNVASAKVLTKSGFEICEELSTPETDMFIYSVPRMLTEQ